MEAPAVEKRDLLAYYLHFCNKTIDAEYKAYDEHDQVWIDGGACTIYGCRILDAPTPFDIEFDFSLKGNPQSKYSGFIDNFVFKESDLEKIVKERDDHVARLRMFVD